MQKHHISFNSSQKLLHSAAFWGWFLIAVFYCYQYLLRVTPGVIALELRQNFHLTAEEFSTLGSYYLYAYSLLQIPIGFIVDRVGVKRSVLVSLLLCILGSFWITQTHSLFAIQLSRALVGLGSACAFMCSLKWVADHFEPGKRGFLMGATLAFGTLGALGAGHPLVYAVENIGWQSAILLTAILGGFIFVLIAFFLKDRTTHPSSTASKSPHSSSSSNYSHVHNVAATLKKILSTKSILIYAFLAVGVYTPLAVLADLWGVTFLMVKFEMTRADAASTTMIMYFGLAVGSIALPPLAERYHAFTRTIQLCSFGLLCAFVILLFIPNLSMAFLKVLFLIIGLLCGAEMICFSGALVGSHATTSGLTIGVVNTMNMLGGALLQQLIGYILDSQWRGALDETGVRLYSDRDYTWALIILPIVLVACVILSMTLKRDKIAAARA